MSFDEELTRLWDRMAANQDDLPCHFALGKAYFERKDFIHAIPHLQKARHDPALLRPAVERIVASYLELGVPQAAERARGYLRNGENGDGSSAAPAPAPNRPGGSRGSSAGRKLPEKDQA